MNPVFPKTCRIHEDVPYIERESGSVHGGTIGWGCAVCNMLKLEEARRRIAQLEAALRKIEKFSEGLDPDDNARQCGHYVASVASTALGMPK